MNKVYPPREFPNLPTYEESRDLWAAELAWRFPVGLRVAMALMTLLTLGVVCASFDALVQALRAGNGIPFSYFVFLVIGFAPLSYIPWVFAKMPPKPTKESYEKTLALMRAYHAMKAQEQAADSAANNQPI